MKTYVLVGAGNRALSMFAMPLFGEVKDYGSLVGIYDTNISRARIVSEEGEGVPIFDDFDSMMKVCRPDAVIVATVDCYHHEYIIKALEYGADAITEKPMTIDAEKCRAILEAEKRTGKRVSVTFNCRFIPYIVRVKELLKENVVGDILSIDMEWLLDTSHGADYFRRWHRNMEKSGGLLVHKSTHHFDMINWWLDEEPKEVFAFGTRSFYGPVRQNRGERCLTCEYKNTCEFYWDIHTDQRKKRLYLNTEGVDGYFRDRCVFADDIDIYDTMSVNVQYEKGALLTYSLIAHSPYEGWKASISGTKGRLEVEDTSSGIDAAESVQHIKLFNRKGEKTILNMKKLTDGHGGGDERLRRMLFVGDVEDPLGQQADSKAGSMSILIGIAANIAINEKRAVLIKDLLQPSGKQ